MDVEASFGVALIVGERALSFDFGARNLSRYARALKALGFAAFFAMFGFGLDADALFVGCGFGVAVCGG